VLHTHVKRMRWDMTDMKNERGVCDRDMKYLLTLFGQRVLLKASTIINKLKRNVVEVMGKYREEVM